MARSNGLDIGTDDDEYATLPDSAPKTGTCPECGADLDAGEEHDTDCSAVSEEPEEDEDEELDDR